MPDMNGKTVSICSFRGKYLLIDFWASWCGACPSELQNALRAYNKYKDKNFSVVCISVDVDTDREKWLKKIEKIFSTFDKKKIIL